MSDDRNIENFFKKRLEKDDFEFAEKDWDKLQERLDRELPLYDGFATTK